MRLSTTHTAQEVASIIGAQIVGDPQRIARGINEIHKVVADDITFVDNQKYYAKSLGSEASIVLINQEVECPPEKTLLVCADPFSCYNKLVRTFSKTFGFRAPEDRPAPAIDPTAVIHPGVTIGEDVVIGPRTVIYPHVVIYPGVAIGADVVIHANSVIGADAFYYKKRSDHFERLESCGRVIIEDGVEIGACSTVDRGVSGDTIIGEHTKIDNHVQIGHGVVVGKRCIISSQAGVSGKTRVGDDVILWGQVGVTKDITIGDGAIVLGQSGVTKSIAGGKTYFGTPATEAVTYWKDFSNMKKLVANKR